jgi:transposase-like protein
MPTPKIAPEISAKFKAAIEKRLREGYAPRGISGGKGSSVRSAAKDIGIATSRLESWVYRQQKDKALGAEHFEPDWSLWNRAATGKEVKIVSAARRWLLTASQNDTPYTQDSGKI